MSAFVPFLGVLGQISGVGALLVILLMLKRAPSRDGEMSACASPSVSLEYAEMEALPQALLNNPQTSAGQGPGRTATGAQAWIVCE